MIIKVAFSCSQFSVATVDRSAYFIRQGFLRRMPSPFIRAWNPGVHRQLVLADCPAYCTPVPALY